MPGIVHKTCEIKTEKRLIIPEFYGYDFGRLSKNVWFSGNIQQLRGDLSRATSSMQRSCAPVSEQVLIGPKRGFEFIRINGTRNN